MKDEITILCTGDLHLGRHPTRIPAELDGSTFSPRTIWQSTVKEAIRRDVDVVVITGDIADRENRYFEAYGAFEEGAVRLDEAGIPIVLVAGNHDFDVLPRMVDDLDLATMQLLGNDGNWESSTVDRDDGPLVHFHGWSFPNQHVLNSPIDDYDLSEETDIPSVGVLHTDLDTPDSQYAPVQTSELRNTPVDAWLLGHIHKPGIQSEADPLVVYPGSPQALDPGEAGLHGPWILTLDSAGGFDTEQVPLASIRYDRVEVDVSQAENSKAVMPFVHGQLTQHVGTNIDRRELKLFLAHIRLTGRTEAHADLIDQHQAIKEQLAIKHGSLPIRVQKLEVATQPAVDLNDLAQGDSPAAYLADLLLKLESDDLSDEHVRLIEDSLETMQEAHGAGAYNQLRREGHVESPDREAARETVQHQARVLLETLLEQKGASV